MRSLIVRSDRRNALLLLLASLFTGRGRIALAIRVRGKALLYRGVDLSGREASAMVLLRSERRDLRDLRVLPFRRAQCPPLTRSLRYASASTSPRKQRGEA